MVLSPDVVNLLDENGWKLLGLTRKGNWYTVRLSTNKGYEISFKTGATMISFLHHFSDACFKFSNGNKEDEEDIQDVGYQMEDIDNNWVVDDYFIYNYPDEWKIR